MSHLDHNSVKTLSSNINKPYLCTETDTYLENHQSFIDFCSHWYAAVNGGLKWGQPCRRQTIHKGCQRRWLLLLVRFGPKNKGLQQLVLGHYLTWNPKWQPLYLRLHCSSKRQCKIESALVDYHQPNALFAISTQLIGIFFSDIVKGHPLKINHNI